MNSFRDKVPLSGINAARGPVPHCPSETPKYRLSSQRLRVLRFLFSRPSYSACIEVAISLHNLADVHFQRGEYAKALSLHEAGLGMRAGLLSPDDRDIADSLGRLATTQMRMERYDAARQNLDKAHAIRVKRTAEEPLDLAHTLELIAWLHRYAGDYAAARGPLEAALTTLHRLAPDHPALITTIEVQGDLLMLEGDVASGARAWQEALALAERTLGRQHPVISTLERPRIQRGRL